MHPDGTVQIDAPRIILGWNDAEKESDADGATGYVKYSEYRNQMEKLHDEVATLADEVGNFALTYRDEAITLATSFGSATGNLSIPLGIASTAGQFGGLGAAAGQLAVNADGGDGYGGVKKAVKDLKDKIPEARSDTIFGE